MKSQIIDLTIMYLSCLSGGRKRLLSIEILIPIGRTQDGFVFFFSRNFSVLESGFEPGLWQ